MRIQLDDTQRRDGNVLPLINIVFLMLIFFLLAGTVAPTADFDLTSRPTTASFVSWNIPPWNTVNETHQSPDLSALVQEVVDRPGWTRGNALVLLFEGSGVRVAESFDGKPTAAPRLCVEFEPEAPNLQIEESSSQNTSENSWAERPENDGKQQPGCTPPAG